ncbi:MAG: SIMPL domain-containing protein [Firmicutes bacterium]|nr:SIMPL domain-containing protein [Bacillota bacterium]
MHSSLKVGLVLGVSLIIAAAIFGSYFYQAQSPGQTISVVGAASKDFEADQVKWTLNIEEEVSGNDLTAGYVKLQTIREKIFALLAKKGIGRDRITLKPAYVYKEYDYNNNTRVFRGYQFQQTIYVITDQVDAVEALAFNPVELLDGGTINSTLEYFYTGIDELKKELVGEATRNARERAEKMVEQTDVKVGKIVSVSSGVFQITEPNSTRVEAAGIHDTSTRRQQIRVTAHVKFRLK